MRLLPLSVAAVAAALIVPSIAAAQSIRVDNNTGTLTLNVSLFNQGDLVNIQPCSTNTIGSGVGAVFEKSGMCGGYTELKLRVTTFRVGAVGGSEPSCWVYNIPWNGTVNITGSGPLSCNRTN